MRVRRFAVMLVALLMLAACSSDDDQGTDPPESVDGEIVRNASDSRQASS